LTSPRLLADKIQRSSGVTSSRRAYCFIPGCHTPGLILPGLVRYLRSETSMGRPGLPLPGRPMLFTGGQECPFEPSWAWVGFDCDFA
jgi:hypothetical protein